MQWVPTYPITQLVTARYYYTSHTCLDQAFTHHYRLCLWDTRSGSIRTVVCTAAREVQQLAHQWLTIKLYKQISLFIHLMLFALERCPHRFTFGNSISLNTPLKMEMDFWWVSFHFGFQFSVLLWIILCEIDTGGEQNIGLISAHEQIIEISSTICGGGF